MSKEAKEARNKYFREWQKKNKDKVKRNQERYWERKAKEDLEKEQQVSK